MISPDFRESHFFHGTACTFQPGDILQPSKETGNLGSGVSPKDHVFVTRYKKHAGDWAVNAAYTAAPDAGSGFERAYVYRVEPLGEVHDDSLEKGSGYMVRSARVLERLPRRQWSRGRNAYKDEHHAGPPSRSAYPTTSSPLRRREGAP